MNDLSRAQLHAICVLAAGRCRISNRTDADDRRVAHQTVVALAADGLVEVHDGRDHRQVSLTAAGQQVAADPPDPPPITRRHGTHACYVLDQCRCSSCREANSTYETARSREAAYGRPRMVDAEPVRQHVRRLMAGPHVGATNGVGLKQIATVSGVSNGALWKLMYGSPDRPGPTMRVRRDTAEALLAVTEADRADGSTVPAGPTCSRLQDLRTAGATWVELAEQTDVSQPALWRLGKGRSDHCTVGTARAVYRLWTSLQDGSWTPRGRRPRWSVNPPGRDDDG